jgi:hypothetical protein
MSLCLACAEPIPSTRLAAIPGATLCVRCAQVPYNRPASPVFPQGGAKLLSELTEAYVLQESAPEQRSAERAAEGLYRQIEGLEEIEQ